MSISEPGGPPPEDQPAPPQVGARAGRARHRRRPRRRRSLPVLVTLIILATTILALASTGAGSYLVRHSGIDLSGMRTRFEQLVEQFRVRRFDEANQASGHAAFCRIGDPGSSTLAQLQPPRFCSIADRGSRSVEELDHPTMCTIGDPGTVELAHLLDQGTDVAWNDDGTGFALGDLSGRQRGDNGQPPPDTDPSGLPPGPDPGPNPDIVPTSNHPPDGGGHQGFPPTSPGPGPDPDPTDPLPNSFHPVTPFTPTNFTNPGGSGNPGGKGGNKGGNGGGPQKQAAIQPVAVSEPGATALFAIGLAGITVLRRRTRRS